MNQILSILTGNTVDESIIEQGYVGNSPYTASCLISTASVYSICNGKVIAVDRDSRYGTWCITVEVDSQHWIRYCKLGSVKVSAGQSLSTGNLLGFAHRNSMRLEYCTSAQSQFPVRILSRQLYKQDPAHILFGQEILAEGI